MAGDGGSDDGSPEALVDTGAPVAPVASSASGATPGGDSSPVDLVGDVRESLANERTLLAWQRTSLALVAAGLVVTQFAPPLDIPGGRRLVGLPLVAIGGLLSVASYHRWRDVQRAIDSGGVPPSTRLPAYLTVATLAAAVVAVVVALSGVR